MKKTIDFFKLDEMKPVILTIFLFFIPLMIAKYDYYSIARNYVDIDVQYNIGIYLLAFHFESYYIYWSELSSSPSSLAFGGVAEFLILLYFSGVFIFYVYKNYMQYKLKLSNFSRLIWNIIKIILLGIIMITYFMIIAPHNRRNHNYAPANIYEHKIDNYYIGTGLVNVKIEKITYDINKELPNKPFLF